MGVLAQGVGKVARFIRDNPSILYSMVLLVVVPVILSGFAWWVTNSFQNLLNVSLQERAVLVHQTIEAFVGDSRDDLELLRSQMQELQTSIGTEVVDYTVLMPAADNTAYTPVAGFSDELTLDAAFTQTQYALAWFENQSFATVAQHPVTGERLLLVTRPLRDSTGQQWGLANVALSLAQHDALVARVMTRAAVVLVVSVLVILLLIANHARLFHYAVDLQQQKKVDQLKDDFISVASHELRTPITGIRSFLSLLKEGQFGSLSAQGTTYIGDALVQADRLNELVTDMLDVSRIEQGRLEMEQQTVSPGMLADEVVQQLTFKAEEKGLRLSLKTDSQATIIVDPNHFRRIMINLIGNAIKYTKQGTVTVTIADREENRVVVSVRDTGIGIPPEQVETLFRKFSRVHSEEMAKVQGTGLGLWITKALTERMGGKIYVSSIYGEGSEFTVIFPRA